VLTASLWDAHPDHRTTYKAVQAAAEVVCKNQGIPVAILSAIIHDEVPKEPPFCCLGDLRWPNAGPNLDYEALSDFPDRPRPPMWDVTYYVSDFVNVRTESLNMHKSQVQGNKELCMILVWKPFYQGWMNKVEEVFYKEILEP
jgi:LmbE family N-acetylglucosaminyl deacetylase